MPTIDGGGNASAPRRRTIRTSVSLLTSTLSRRERQAAGLPPSAIARQCTTSSRRVVRLALDSTTPSKRSARHCHVREFYLSTARHAHGPQTGKSMAWRAPWGHRTPLESAILGQRDNAPGTSSECSPSPPPIEAGAPPAQRIYSSLADPTGSIGAPTKPDWTSTTAAKRKTRSKTNRGKLSPTGC